MSVWVAMTQYPLLQMIFCRALCQIPSLDANKTSHKGMGINESDWEKFIGHLNATLDNFQLPQQERSDVIEFIESTKADIVE
jgi:hypothetical protein